MWYVHGGETERGREKREMKTERKTARAEGGREKGHTCKEDRGMEIEIGCAYEKSNCVYIFNPVIVTFHANYSLLVSSLLPISS